MSSTGLPATLSLLPFAILNFAVFNVTARLYMFLPPERHVHPTATSLFRVYLPLGSATLQEYRAFFQTNTQSLLFAVCLYRAHQLYNVPRISTPACLLHNKHINIIHLSNDTFV